MFWFLVLTIKIALNKQIYKNIDDIFDEYKIIIKEYLIGNNETNHDNIHAYEDFIENQWFESTEKKTLTKITFH